MADSKPLHATCICEGSMVTTVYRGVWGQSVQVCEAQALNEAMHNWHQTIVHVLATSAKQYTATETENYTPLFMTIQIVFPLFAMC